MAKRKYEKKILFKKKFWADSSSTNFKFTVEEHTPLKKGKPVDDPLKMVWLTLETGQDGFGYELSLGMSREDRKGLIKFLEETLDQKEEPEENEQ